MTRSFDRRGFLRGAAAVSAAAPLASALAAAPQPSTKRAWEGIFVIMQTPFHDDLSLDEESLRKETDFLARGRVQGVVWPAGAGETNSLSYTERMRHSEAVVKEAKGRTTVLIGVHGANKFEAMDYARHAEKIGADGLHVLGPTDGTGDNEILADYFTSVASVSKLPMCIQVSNAGMSTDFLLRMAGRIPSLRILKLEAGDVPQDVTRVVKERKRPLIPSTGGGAMYLYQEMERGSGGTMAGAGFADIQTEIWDLFHAGKKQESLTLFEKFLLSAVLERRTTFVLQKEILRRRGIFKNTVMRRTRRFTMDAADLHELDRIMEMLKPHFRV
ncbi:MAG: dihydrodipicolinate synthase family protein [Bryobacterales bacterium]|nr:dihydrodipicolinate synthase family protein [Bryobacterales bacterium]